MPYHVPGGINPNEPRTSDAYATDVALQTLASDVLSSLTFAPVLELGVDARPVPLGGEAREVREAQRQRIDAAFGALANPRPEHVQHELLTLFRAEAASVEMAREGGEASLLETAPEEEVKALKKELKQRIHEWEGSFRRTAGREPAPQDKAGLRAVYEVYKVTKNRLTVGGAATNSAASSAAPAVLARPVEPAAQRHPVSAPRPQPTGAADGRPSTAAAPRPLQAGPSSGLAQAAPRPATAGASTTAASASAATAASTGNAAAAPSPAIAAPPSTSAAIRNMSRDDVAAEKRRLKRRLHQFENDFEKRHGRPPQKDDRREFAAEYQRYAELKSVLNDASDH